MISIKALKKVLHKFQSETDENCTNKKNFDNKLILIFFL